MISIRTEDHPAGRFEVADLEVCTGCILLLSNGPCGGCTSCVDAKIFEVSGEQGGPVDPCTALAERMEAKWGDDDAPYLIPGGDDLGYCTTECDGCGDGDHGDRFTAFLSKPIVKG